MCQLGLLMPLTGRGVAGALTVVPTRMITALLSGAQAAATVPQPLSGAAGVTAGGQGFIVVETNYRVCVIDSAEEYCGHPQGAPLVHQHMNPPMQAAAHEPAHEAAHEPTHACSST